MDGADRRILERQDVDHLLAALTRRGYTIVGPTA